MDCKECTEQLTAFLDAELNAREAEQIKSHLSACKPCSEEWNSLRESKDFIESHVPDMEPRPEAWNLVRARIIAERPSPSPYQFLIVNRWRVAIAALALMASAGIGYVRYQQYQRTTLDRYVSQYIHEREALRQVTLRSVPITTQPASGIDEVNSYPDNPFLEIKATVTNNPFRLEDR